MKHALTIGCGSKNGKTIIDTLLEKNYLVTNIGSSSHPGAHNVTVNWNDIKIPDIHKIVKFNHDLDFVFFNHNASSLKDKDFDFINTDTLSVWKLVKDWQKTHWLSCQMPLLMLHGLRENLSRDTKVGFMLSSFVDWTKSNAAEFPDYSSQKYFNYLAMRCLSQHYQSFGIMPNFSKKDSQNKLKQIISTVCDQTVNGDIFNFEQFTSKE